MTPPASVLCRICGDTIFMTTGNPISEASFTASSAVFARPSLGMVIPYASQTPRASGAVSASRLAALAWSRILRTAFLSFVIIGFLEWWAGERSPALLRMSVARASNYFFQSQSGDIRGRVPELRQNLIGVLTQQGRALNLGRA